jgi:protein-histidine pros-kinase
MEGSEKLLFMARPIKITNPACLSCHSVPEAAPVAMINKYGSENGFGWQVNEIIGAQVLSVPTSLPEGMARNAFQTLMTSLALVFVATLVVLNVVLRFAVVKPVKRLSSMADSISKGDLSVAEMPVHGTDEISLLSASFNRMRRSLEKALKMLD